MSEERLTLRLPILKGPSVLCLEHAFFGEEDHQRQVVFELKHPTTNRGPTMFVEVTINTLTRGEEKGNWKFAGVAVNVNSCNFEEGERLVSGYFSTQVRRGRLTLQLSRKEAEWAGVIAKHGERS